jgi:phosphoribosylformylglycinamidine synthase
VAFASKELTDRSESESRGAVQLGNPIMKEPLIHACLEAYDRGLVRGQKDLGGGGLATASGELVNSGGFGSRIELTLVPLREEGLLPWEVWISESQERMILDVAPADVPDLLAIFRRHDVPATDIGEVVADPYETLLWKGERAAHLRVGFRVDPPVIHRPTRPRRRRVVRSPDLADEVPAEVFTELVLAPDSVSREPVLRVYDHEVQGRTVVKPLHGRVTSPAHGDAAVLQPRPSSRRGLAIATSTQPWACSADPEAGAVMVVEEAARNLYAVGARPDAFTNCLNFGNPEDPRVLADFASVTRGLGRGAKALGFAVPSGNVSFYNEGLGVEIPPTPVLLATGIVDDITRALTSDLKESGNALYLLGRSLPELGGSLWARRHALSHLAVPRPDPAGLRRVGERLLSAGRRGLLRSVHDLSDGGLAVTLAEMAFGGGLGFDVDLAATRLATPSLALAAEGASRFVVEVPASARGRFERAFAGFRAAPLGTVTPSDASLRWKDRRLTTVPLTPLYERWRSGLGIP